MQPANRPASVFVIAVFHFIIGGLGLLCNCYGMATLAAGGDGTFGMGGGDPRQAKMQKDIAAIMKATPAYTLVQVADTVGGLILSGVLLLAGYGLLNMEPWARSASLWYGTLYLILKVGVAFYSILFMFPAFDQAMRIAMTQSSGGAMADQRALDFALSIAKIGMFVGMFIPLIYPFIVLLVMNTAGVKAAFAGAPPSSELPEESPRFGDPFGKRREEGPGPDDRFRKPPDEHLKG
ncbi:MAG: hypothetical protein K2R98_05780 [Gemmataceae bacterium]|nr:hypothetical protein [Gemmataceae bacterium]